MLSYGQNLAIEKAKEGHNFAVLGQSGTGKSFIGKKLKEILENVVYLTATTEIVAVNIGCKTLHRWSGMGDGRY